MSGFRYTPPSRSELEEIARSDLTQDQLVDIAERGKDHAEAIAPVETGAFRSSFRVVRGDDGEALIVNDDPGAAAIEHGSDDTPAHHVMAQTIDWLEREAR